MNGKVRAVIRKELREYRRNKLVVGTMAVMPIFFFVLPLLSVVAQTPSARYAAIKGAVGGATLSLLVMPLILPTIVAGYAVVGERDQGTLEPVLTTPVSREEFLLGKALAACVPTISVAYVLYALFILIVRAAGAPEAVRLISAPAELIALGVAAPLLATFSIWVGLAISVRSTDVRAAQQLSALAVLPIVGLLVLFTFRIISPTVTVAITGAVIVALLDLVAWRVVSRMFDPERVLTRYGRG
jgi:ABC-type transport system involved in multi-copper enzyme maturation permease subunit